MPFPDSLDIPQEVSRIAERLEAEGFDTWCVGGAIRDNLLGQRNKDFDLATSARPEDVRRLFKRTIPIGVEHGTVAVLDRHRTPHEITTFRRDVKTDGRHAVVEFGVSIDEDLARRDFTINAIAYHPLRREWRDPFDGEGDIERGVVRAVGDPVQRFREDYLRILRALRFAARFGFAIEGSTWEAARDAADGLHHLSAERVRDEWFKGLETARQPSELVRLWEDVGAIGVWLPEVVERGRGKRERDVANRLGRDPVLITAFLSTDPGASLTRLRCSRAEIDRAERIGRFRGTEPDGDDAVAVRRWLAEVGPAADDVLTTWTAAGGDPRLATAVAGVRSSGAPCSLAQLAIDGNTLREMGLREGPLLGKTLRRLLDEVLEDPGRNTTDYLTARARELASGPGSDGNT